MRTTIPADLSREEAFMVIMSRLHGRWRLAILMPPLYLILGAWALNTIFLPSEGRAGLFPLSNDLFHVLCLMGGLMIGALWILLGRSLANQQSALQGLGSDSDTFMAEARRHQLIQFAICDLASSVGIFLFLIQGDFTALLAFCLASEILYLKVFPSDLRLGEAMFRSGQP